MAEQRQDVTAMEDHAAGQEKHIPSGERLPEVVSRTCLAHCRGNDRNGESGASVAVRGLLGGVQETVCVSGRLPWASWLRPADGGSP